MSWLLITGEDGAERAVPLADATLRIGRAADSDVVLADAKKSVSRSHAEVRCEAGCYVIVDLESQNGTWLDGERVQRAELPVGGKVHVGTFRLELRDGDAPGGAVTTTTVSGAIPPPVAEVVISHPTAPRTHGRAPAPAASVPAAASRSNAPIAIAAVVGLAVIGGVAWKMMQPPAPPATEAAPSMSAQVPAPPASPPASPATVPTEPAAAPQPEATPTTEPVALPPASKHPAASAASSAPAAPREDSNASAAIRPARTTQPPVPRKPDETVDQWHNRIEALQARYDASKVALQRGDYASAASGFEAILRAEPGFGDVPELLVRARAGLRASAIDLLNAGKRLDASGDWMGAMQQFERARDVDASTPGIDAAVARVKEELRDAGQQALERGLDQERQGHTAQALQEYNKAIQWLPADDPGLATARTRAERLRISQ